MSQVCRLCTNICSDSISLCDANGSFNEVHQITIKFFHPTFLRLDHDVRNQLAILCFECWKHISDFHNFQQTVLLVQAKLLRDAEKSPAKILPQDSNITATQTDIFKEDEEFVSLSEEELTNNCALQFEAHAHSLKEKEINSNVKILIDTDDDEDNLDYLSDEFEEPVGTFIREAEENSNISFSELELIDLQSSSDNEHSVELQNDIMSIATTTNDSSQSRATSKRKRKTLKQLDDIIAQWRPIIECEVCRKPFLTFTLLQTHFREVHPSEEWYVVCCQTRFKYRCRLEQHIRAHLDPETFVCEFCSKCFTSKCILDSHILFQHTTATGDLNIQDDSPQNVDQDKMAKYKHKCHICGKTYRVPSALREHFTIHTGEPIHKCSYCSRKFKYRSSLCHHLTSAHPEEANKTNRTGCSHCPKTFTFRTGLYHHLRIFHPEEFAKRRTQKGIH